MIKFREHGNSGPLVIVLHGGPAAAGSAFELARGLADRFRVIEPWQRGSSDEPLTVARHVADLWELITQLTGDSIQVPGDATPAPTGDPTTGQMSKTTPALIGESWGAMLALAYGAAYPEDTGPLILVGCGTFDPVSRAKIGETLTGRIDRELREQLDRIPDEISDPQARLEQQYELCHHLYDHDCTPAAADDQAPPFDMQAHTETWNDMLRLQDEGVYPAAFAAIKSPVLMLHGGYDPHPGTMIRDNLLPHLPHLEYHEWSRCGHSPWRERGVLDDFFAMVKRWLTGHLSI